jgi:hypothetical protein
MSQYEWVNVGINRMRLVKKGHPPPEPRRKVSLYPYESTALGCTPEHADIETARARRRGVNVEYTNDGDAIITSASQRDKLMDIYGIGTGGGMKTGRKR